MLVLAANPLVHRLKELRADFPGVGQVNLVGGAVRDGLLGFTPIDFDYTTEHDPTMLARGFARVCGGHWFWLDERRCQSRVVIAGGSFDFAPWRASTLAGDLARRDFTINAMAVDLAGDLHALELIDPLGGCQHLAKRILCCAGPGVLEDDPLRLLKGIRHVAELGLAVAPETLDAMHSCAERLIDMAPERLRVEFWRILAAPDSRRGIGLLVDAGVGEVLLHREFSRRQELVHSALGRAIALLDALVDGNSQVESWLCAPVEQGLARRTLLLWWRALGVIAAELPLALAQRWRFGRSAQARIAALGRMASHPWPELFRLPKRPRQVSLWAQQFGPDPVDLLLAIGLLRDDDLAQACCRLQPYLQALAELDDPGHVPALVTGDWVMRELAVAGPALGGVLDVLRRAEIAGSISGSEEARRFLLEHNRKNS